MKNEMAKQKMSDILRFDAERYVIKTCQLEGSSITYRAFENIVYCAAPVDPIQKLNLFVPEIYYQGGQVNGYTFRTAPIFMPNTVGGYMPGPAGVPGKDFRGEINSVFRALEHGYVVVCPGIRGRISEGKREAFFVGGVTAPQESDASNFTGKAPALIVDMKAAVRYLRYNRDRIPGDVEHIITNGTSAGGALSAMTGATGNSPDYAAFLAAIGAADERDDVFAASCYCPIHNLEHADAAYEWLFSGCREYYNKTFTKVDGEVREVVVCGNLTDKQRVLAGELKKQFPAYVNSLGLFDSTGNILTLNEEGEGSFKEYIGSCILASAQRELDERNCEKRLKRLAVQGSEVEKQSCLRIVDGCVKALDWEEFVKTITRMKPVPAFDTLDLSSPENEEFGTEWINAKHFTVFSQRNSEVKGELADEQIIRLMNPTEYIGRGGTAKHWRIRHGAFDRDISLAMPVILALLLENRGCDVDFFLPWGLPHAGDYDLEDLFVWIDKICR